MSFRFSTRSALPGGKNVQVVLRNQRKNREAFLNLLFLFPIFQNDVCRFFLASQFALEDQPTETDVVKRANYLTDAVDRVRSEKLTLLEENRRLVSTAAATAVRIYLARPR